MTGNEGSHVVIVPIVLLDQLADARRYSRRTDPAIEVACDDLREWVTDHREAHFVVAPDGTILSQWTPPDNDGGQPKLRLVTGDGGHRPDGAA